MKLDEIQKEMQKAREKISKLQSRMKELAAQTFASWILTTGTTSL